MRETTMFRSEIKSSALGAVIAIWLVLLAGCAEDVTKLGPPNNLRVVSVPDTFLVDIDDMDNVYEELSWDWEVTATRIHVTHRSFVPHGENELRLIDAAGDTVYSRHLLYGLEGDSKPGVPGTWKVQLDLFGTTGRVGVTLTPTPQ